LIKNDALSTFLGACGLTVSIQDLTQIINVVLLVVSLINILYGLGLNIYNHIKEKNFDKVKDDFEKAKQDINNIKEEIENGEDRR